MVFMGEGNMSTPHRVQNEYVWKLRRLGTLAASRRVNVPSTFTPFPSSVDRQTGSERTISIRGECRVMVGARWQRRTKL